MVKADATAFFKLVSRKRCLEEIRDAIECLRTAGAAGFLLHREDKTKSVVYWGRKVIPRTHRLVDFQEVLQTLSFIDSDRFFTLGTSIFERIDGLAMGNATSPAITAFDLDTNATKMYDSKQEAQRVGAYVASLPTTRCIQALLHVDDALVFSKVFCCRCLGEITKKAWPEDVEAKIEESGPSIGFLHCRVFAHPNSIFTNEVTFSAQIPNEKFCKGITSTPRCAKMQQFVNSRIHNRKHLQAIL